MADPMTMAIFGTGMQAVGQIQQGMAANNAAKYNARTSEFNARLAQQKGEREERQVRRQSRQHLGRMRANIGASGVQMEGSALDMMADSAYQAEMDALTTRFNTSLQVSDFKSQARMQRVQGKSTRNAAYLQAGTSLLMGGSQARAMS